MNNKFPVFLNAIKKSYVVFAALSLVVGGFFIATPAFAAATVTPVGNGTNISIDTSSAGVSPSWKSLGSFSFIENGDIAIGTHTITLPTGWEFKTDSPISIGVGNDATFASISIAPDTTSFTFEVTGKSAFEGTIMFTGLKVRPTGTTPGIGNMTYSGEGIAGVTPGPGEESTNFGTLSTIAGTVTKLAFTSEPTETVYGSTISEVVVKTQDQFGNLSTSGLAATETVTLTLNGSGTLQGTLSQNIGTGGGNGTAIFSDLTVNSVGTEDTITATPSTYAPIISSSFNITPLPITVTTTAGQTKVYGQVDPVFAYTVTSGALVSGDSFTGLLSRVEGDTVADYAINQGTLNAGANYALTFVSDNFSITAKNLTISGATAVNKVYDGNNTATLDFTGASLVGVEAGDTGNVTIDSSSASGIFSGVDVATGQTVTVTGVVLGGSAAGNYTVSQPVTSADITQRPLTVTATGVNKVYDANPTATVTLSDDRVLGDVLTLGYAATFTDGKNIGSGKPVSVTGISITGGAAAGNYILGNTTAITTADITAKPLTVSFTIEANKTYNGSATADITGRILDGVISPEVVNVTGGSATFADKHIGLAKTVTATGFALTGVDSGNYSIGTINTTTGNVNPRPITVTAVTGAKTYNGTTASAGTPIITNTGGLTTGPIMGSDVASFTQAYDTKNVGTGKTLTPTGTVTDGNSGNNYVITPVTISTGEITQALLTATVIVEKKVVDGNNSATITSVTLSGILLSDAVTVNSQGTATFANTTVGTHAVTATGVTITGGDTGNYDFNGTATGTGEILAVPAVVYVDDNWATGVNAWTDPDGSGPATYFGYDAFATIQEGINAVKVGGTVNVVAGIYNESLLIEKSLILRSAETTKPVISGVSGSSYIIKVNGVSGVIIDNLEINGGGTKTGDNTFDYGILVNNSGISENPVEIKNSDIKNVWKNQGKGIGVEMASYVLIYHNTISSFQKSGIRFVNSDGKFYNNEVIGDNVVDGTSRVQNLVNLWTGSDVEIYNNKLYNARTQSGVTPTWDSVGVFVSAYYGSYFNSGNSSASIHDNEIYDCDSGIVIGSYYAPSDSSSVIITNNNLYDLEWAINFEKGTVSATITGNKFTNVNRAVNADDSHGGPVTKPTINAKENYWGTAVLTTIQGKVYENVDFEPYYVDAGMKILNTVPVNEVSVDANYTDGNTGEYIFGYNAFATIQEGIDAIEAGGTVNVAAGTYTTMGQVVIDKNLTINGIGEIKPIISPIVDLPATNNVSGAWFLVNAGVTFNLNDVVLDGNSMGVYQGVRSHGATIIDGVDFLNIRNTAAPYVGFAIASFGGTVPGGAGSDTHISGGAASTLIVTSSTFAQIGRIGILIKGTGSTATISGNTYTGKGNGSFLDYAFEFGAGGSGTISGNTISDNRGVAASDGSTSAGILVTDYYGIGTSANITGNTITNCTDAIAVGYLKEDGSVVVAQNNKFDGNDYGVSSTGPIVNATENWWGSENGPTHTSNPGDTGDAVSDNVNFRPWYLSNALSGLDSTAPTVALTYSANPAKAGSMTITATYSEAITGTPKISINQQGTTDVSSADMSGGGAVWTYAYTVATADGSAYVDGIATVSLSSVNDPSGNIAGSPTGNIFTIDTTVPTATISYSTTAITKNDVIATITPSEPVTVTNNGGSLNYTFTINGDFTFTFIDAAGNPGTVTATVANIDKIVPTAPVITSISDNNFINNSGKSAVVVVGTAEANSLVSVTLSDGPVSVSKNQQLMDNAVNFSITLDGSALADGVITPSVTATDAAGNISEVVVTPTAIKDVIVPSIIEGSLSPVKNAVGVALDATVSLAFSEKVNIGSVVVRNNTTGVDTTISGAGISFNDVTKTATITLPVGTLQSNTVYIVTVNNIQDEAGNSIVSYGSDNSWKFTTATGYSINLVSGWNLISLPVTPTTWRSIPDTLTSVSGKVNRIWTYDAPNGKWLVYNSDPSVPSDANFTSLEAGRGYWVEMNANGALVGSGTLYEQLVPSGGQPSGSLPQVQLAEGWNLIGYYQLPGKTTAPIANALSKLSGAWSGDESDIITFTPNTLQPLTPILIMNPGEGYWIYMSNAKKYSFGN